MKYLIANWKAEMTKNDIDSWLVQFEQLLSQNPNVQSSLHGNLLSITICPPFPYISHVKKIMDTYNVHVGSQTVSSETHGKFTGEVTAEALSGLITHAIIGHSERRIHFGETNEDIEKKIAQCTATEIVSILCIRNEQDAVFDDANLIAYEPVDAIGSGRNEDPAQVVAMKKKLTFQSDTPFIYGGSVDEQNIKDYISTGEVDGFLVGTASLHARQFFTLAEQMIA